MLFLSLLTVVEVASNAYLVNCPAFYPLNEIISPSLEDPGPREGACLDSQVFWSSTQVACSRNSLLWASSFAFSCSFRQTNFALLVSCPAFYPLNEIISFFGRPGIQRRSLIRLAGFLELLTGCLSVKFARSVVCDFFILVRWLLSSCLHSVSRSWENEQCQRLHLSTSISRRLPVLNGP